jgi:hypothetical protein
MVAIMLGAVREYRLRGKKPGKIEKEVDIRTASLLRSRVHGLWLEEEEKKQEQLYEILK